MNRVTSFCLHAAQNKAVEIGKSQIKKRAPALAEPFAPLFWLRHPMKAFYFFLLWQTARFGFTLLKRYLR